MVFYSHGIFHPHTHTDAQVHKSIGYFKQCMSDFPDRYFDIESHLKMNFQFHRILFETTSRTDNNQKCAQIQLF